MGRKRIAGAILFAIGIALIGYGLGWVKGSRFECNDENPTSKIKDNTELLKTQEKTYKSDLSPEDCRLCGKEDTLIPVYSGQNNIGIISLNSFQLLDIRINRYDEEGNLEKGQVNGLETSIMSTGDNGFMAVVSVDPNRGYGTADISMNGDKCLNLDNIQENICDTCLQNILQNTWGESYGIGLINFQTGEIRLLSEGIRGFLLGDYYLTVEPRTEIGESGISDLDIHIFFCPERY